MQARIYDMNTRIELFETCFEESEYNKFVAFLEAHGFTPTIDNWLWENTTSGHECAIFD